MPQFIKLTSAHNEAALAFNVESIALVIDNESENESDSAQPMTFVFIEGQPNGFGVKEAYTKVLDAVRT